MINQLPEKLYYNIGEISNAFGVKPSLIRFWEKEFNIINPKKSNKGTRKFSIKDVEKINLIYSLVKKKGYTLEGAKKQILNGENGNLDVLKRLQKIRLELLRMKEEL
ncbi:MAG: MerR family transcriptional regulator [Bacteroidota bacterium]|jgi:DNA-binding transcriptional MerR regulator|nr:transcriptional regulator [Flavobacteriales bacterium]MEC8364097.1 MerR family transcriptional regulator [Bacteroidota bacterium]|tara:strand:+ start:129 stop:449 length:321 start_codon:yes stop_codon:yes gene_type:complete